MINMSVTTLSLLCCRLLFVLVAYVKERGNRSPTCPGMGSHDNAGRRQL